jgi:hypothetical protein
MPDISPFTEDAIKLPDPSSVSPVPASPAIEDAVILNDEVLIDVAPDRPGGKIRVRFVHAGRSIPIPADDPWAE